jgi:hypothetical protein
MHVKQRQICGPIYLVSEPIAPVAMNALEETKPIASIYETILLGLRSLAESARQGEALLYVLYAGGAGGSAFRYLPTRVG